MDHLTLPNNGLNNCNNWAESWNDASRDQLQFSPIMYCMIKYFDTPLVPPTPPHTVSDKVKYGLELMEMAQKEIFVEHQKYVMHLDILILYLILFQPVSWKFAVINK